MDLGIVGIVCDFVILIGAVVLAFDRIIKPIGIFKKKADKTFEEKVGDAIAKAMPEILQ